MREVDISEPRGQKKMPCSFLNKLKGKILRSDLMVMTVCCMFVMLTLSIFFPGLVKVGEEETISITSIDRSPDSQGHEVEITPMVNGKMIEAVRRDDNWEKRESYFICQSYEQTITFTFNSLNDNQLILYQNPYAVRILIEHSSGRSEIVDLCAETAGTIEYPLSSITHLRSPLSLALRVLIAVIVYLIFCMLFRFWFKQIKQSAIFVLFLCFAALFLIKSDLTYQYNVLILIYLICILYAIKNNVGVSYQTNKGLCVLTILLSFYTAFAFWGYELFLKDVIWNTEIKHVVIYLFLSAMTYPFVLCCLEALERTRLYICQQKDRYIHTQNAEEHRMKKHRISFRLALWLLMSSLLISACLLFEPANLTWDLIDQWTQARGFIPIADAHPALHTLFIRLCSMIYPNPVSVTIAQSLILTYVMASILSFLEKKGFPRRFLWIVAIVISVSPTTIAMITLISKNILVAIVMLWLVYLFMEMFDDPQSFFQQSVFLTQFVSAFSTLYIIRHDMFVILPFVAGILFYMEFKHFQNVRLRPIAVLIASLLLITFIKGPLYDAVGVQGQKTTEEVFSPPGTLVTPYTTAMKIGMDLPENICSYLDGILPLEEWENRYAPYNGDVFGWGNPRPDFSQTNLSEVFANYFWLLFKRPDIVMKDRLDGANLDWDVFSHPGVLHDPYTLGIWSVSEAYADMEPSVYHSERRNEDGTYSVGSKPLTQFLYKWIRLFDDTAFFQAIFWRNGLYLILFLLLLVFSVRQRLYRILAIGSIPLIHLIILFCLFGCPMFQYFWFFPLNITLLSLYAVSSQGTKQRSELPEKRDNERKTR
ncbi:hypothetical protein AALA82_13650 [Oscillospiraceae bacterium 50-16]